MHHELKILPRYFQPVLDGAKPFEIRDNSDRNFKGVFGKECVQILGVGIESSCLDSDYSEHAKLEE